MIKGYSLEPDDKTGKLVWKAPEDKNMVIFSPYGIHLIRNTICWYLNKNLLLSNFDEETIKKKMLKFTNDLIDTISAEYNKVFQYPSVAECIDVLKERINTKAEISLYAKEIAGIKTTKEEIIKEKFEEIEERIEEEINKIKEQIIKNKIKRFILTVRTIQDAVHATFMRAWRGEERRTLRQHTHISENRGMPLQITSQKRGGIWPWSRK